MLSNKEINELIDDLKRLEQFESDIKKQKEVLRQRLYNYMGEHESLTNFETGEEGFVTWKYSKPRQTFDMATFKKECAATYNEYAMIGEPVRTLRISK